MITTLHWVLTIAAVIALLGLDLVVSGRRREAPDFRAAVGWSVFYIAVALLFGVVLALTAGWKLGTEYFAGYAVEKTLSVDNLFVMVIIISSFAVPAADQRRVLTYGIVTALALRVVFIAVGAALLGAFSAALLAFGLLLMATAVQLLRHRGETPDPDRNPLLRLLRRRLPQAGVLVALGATDALFALDSIPAVYGVTSHPYIVFAANAFALLGLRALYFLVAGLLKRLVYLSIGMAAILAFIGAKLVLEYLHHLAPGVPEIGAIPSLGVIAALLAITTVASLMATRGTGGPRGTRSGSGGPDPVQASMSPRRTA